MVNIKRKIVYIDTNIFIYYFNKDSQFGEKTRLVLREFRSKNARFITSIISLSEILSFKSSEPIAEQIEQSFFDTPALIVLDVDRFIASDAGRIRRKNKSYRLPDSLHLATALQSHATEFITNDKKLLGFPELKVKLLANL